METPKTGLDLSMLAKVTAIGQALFKPGHGAMTLEYPEGEETVTVVITSKEVSHSSKGVKARV